MVVNADELGEQRFSTKSGGIIVSTGGTLSAATFSLYNANAAENCLQTTSIESGDERAVFSGLSADAEYIITIQSTDAALEDALIKIAAQ